MRMGVLETFWVCLCLSGGSLCLALDSADLRYRPVFKAKRNLAQMTSERIIRVLTTHNLTHFFVDITVAAQHGPGHGFSRYLQCTKQHPRGNQMHGFHSKELPDTCFWVLPVDVSSSLHSHCQIRPLSV